MHRYSYTVQLGTFWDILIYCIPVYLFYIVIVVILKTCTNHHFYMSNLSTNIKKVV